MKFLTLSLDCVRMGFPERTAIERKPMSSPAAHPAGPTLQMTCTADYLARVSARTRPDAPPSQQ